MANIVLERLSTIYNKTSDWLKNRSTNKEQKMKNKKKAEDDYRPADWRLINVFLYYILLIVGNGIFLMLMIWFISFAIGLLTGADISLSWTILGSFFLLGSGLAWPRSGKTFKVPNEHVAVLTILGRRFDFFLLEGDYPEPEPGSIISRSKEEKQGFTTDGFVNMGKIQFQIWNDRKSKEPTLENIARNGAKLFANLLIEVRVYNPRLLLNTEDPLLALAERARTAFRTAISFFIDRDNATVKTILVNLMMGKTIVTSFVNSENARNYEQGSIIRDRTGSAMKLQIADDDAAEAKHNQMVEEAKIKFCEMVEDDADERLLKLLPRKEGKVQVVAKSVDQSLDAVLRSIGCESGEVSVSNVVFDTAVAGKAALASSEAYDARIVQDSAQTLAEGEKILAESRVDTDEKLDELDRILVAAKDNDNIKINHVSGSSSDASKAASVVAEALERSKR